MLRRTADDTDPTERAVVANADQLLIVVALADYATHRPGRPRYRRFTPAGFRLPLSLTKTDLFPAKPFGKQFAESGIDRNRRRRRLPSRGDLAGRRKITVLLGHSGVGKPTLVNRLVPEADRAVGEVTDRPGRHTSTRLCVALPLEIRRLVPLGD